MTTNADAGAAAATTAAAAQAVAVGPRAARPAARRSA